MPPQLDEVRVSNLPGIERTLELARMYLDMDMALLVDHGGERDTLGDVTGSGVDIGAALRLTHVFTEQSRRGRRWRVVGDTTSHVPSIELARAGIGAFVSAKVITADRVPATLTCLSREPMSFLGAKEGRVLCVLADKVSNLASNAAITGQFAADELTGIDDPGRAIHPVEGAALRREPSVAEPGDAPVLLCPLCQRRLIQLNHRIAGRDVRLRACGHCDLRWWETDGLLCTLPDLLDIVREEV